MGYIIVFVAGGIIGAFIMSSMIVSGECQRKEEKEMMNKN